MSDIDLNKIGNILRNRRMEKNLSIRDLSARSDVAASTISQIETGKTSPNLLTLKSLCNALDLPVFSLFMDDEITNVRLVRHNEQQTFIRNISNGKALIESLITQGRNEMWGAIIVFRHIPIRAPLPIMAAKSLYLCWKEHSVLNLKIIRSTHWKNTTPCTIQIISAIAGQTTVMKMQRC